MKQLTIIIATVFALSLFSCTKVAHSHKAVMERYHTKSAVANEFGVPSEKREDKEIEEWLYSFGATPVKASNEKVDSNYSAKNGNNAVFDTTRSITKNVDQFSIYDRYVKFTFNPDSTVRSWDSKGVNYTERKKDKVASAVVIGVGIAGLLIIIGGAIAGMALNGF